MFFVGLGLEVMGIDSAPLAIEKARAKAASRGSKASFVIDDALELERLGVKFDTITDCGLFHTFSDEERAIFTKSLHSALKPGGTYFMLCFSDKEPAEWGGPRRVSEKEIRDTFRQGWEIDWIREAKFESAFHDQGGQAWLASITAT